MAIENLTIAEEDVHLCEATKFTEGQNISPLELMARRQPLADIQCVGSAAAEPGQLHTQTVFTRAWEDTSLEDVPTRNVDYLSHEWVEEDIWTSWRYILSRNDFRDKVRLANASWRTWAKLRCHLMTVSPDTLNWFKDGDVTWLYGPLKICSKRHSSSDSSPPSNLSMSSFALPKESILKTKSISNHILERSFLENTILKNAGAIVQVQKYNNTQSDKLERLMSESILPRALAGKYVISSRSFTPNSTPTATPWSGSQTPHDRRHVHFNDEIEQCNEPKYHAERRVDEYVPLDTDESSDYWPVMKKHRSVTAVISIQCSVTDDLRWENEEKTPRVSTTLETKAIYYRYAWRSTEQYDYRQTVPKGSRHLPDESFRPSTLEFHLGDNRAEKDLNWPPTRTESPAPRSSTVNTEAVVGLASGLYLTSSGMLMPLEFGNDPSLENGIFSKIVDFVNAFRDIAYVIWS